MKIRYSVVGAALALLAGGIALAQYPSLQIPSPTGSELMSVEGTGPQRTQVQMRQVRDASGYQKVVPLTGFSIQIASGSSVLQLTPAGTIAAGTVLFPLVPVDGQRLQIFSTAVVTALTLTPAAGQTINGGVTTIGANGNVEYIYSASNTSWDRIQ
jgi:hypothetical protein